jgi:hypothetical protein
MGSFLSHPAGTRLKRFTTYLDEGRRRGQMPFDDFRGFQPDVRPRRPNALDWANVLDEERNCFLRLKAAKNLS